MFKPSTMQFKYILFKQKAPSRVVNGFMNVFLQGTRMAICHYLSIENFKEHTRFKGQTIRGFLVASLGNPM